MGTVEYFESYIENAMVKGNEKTHEALYRITFVLFNMVCEDTFSRNKREKLTHLENLNIASERISNRLISRWEGTLS